eukprot:SAG11_NODE_33253_length_278_cov_0.860335_1_plen_52_part_01
MSSDGKIDSLSNPIGGCSSHQLATRRVFSIYFYAFTRFPYALRNGGNAPLSA